MEPKIRVDRRRRRRYVCHCLLYVWPAAPAGLSFRRMRAVVTAETVAARFGSETAQKYANVRAAFTPIASKLFQYFKDLGRGDDVRDEGVAGSNPATPTIT
jgi:hypothetical protein